MGSAPRGVQPVAGPVVIDIRTSSVVSLVATVLLLAALSAAGVYAAVDTRDTAVTVIGIGCSVVFGAPVLLLLATLPRWLVPRGIAIDAWGVTYWEGKSRTLLAWPALAAVGVGHEKPPDTPQMPALSVQDAVKGYAEGKLKDAMKLDGRRSFGLEIFPVNPQDVDRTPLMSRYRRAEEPPVPGLPPVRWRIPLPPVLGTVRRAGHGVQAFAPQRWLGEFERPWTQGLRWPPGQRRSAR